MRAKVYPKTNISRKLYKNIVNDIEHDPLVRHSTLSVACLIAAVCVLLGALIWFARSNPGNLVQANGTVTGISSGKTDMIGTETTFVTFDFTTRGGQAYSVRQPAPDGINFSEGQAIKVGYHPKNPNFARNLADNRPPKISIALWLTPFYFMLWFILVALFRYRTRQLEIWKAAEAAEADD